MTAETDSRRGLLYYEQMLGYIADELNVKSIVIDTGLKLDNQRTVAVYDWDTIAQQPISLTLQVGGTVVDAPKTLLAIIESWMDNRKDTV